MLAGPGAGRTREAIADPGGPEIAVLLDVLPERAIVASVGAGSLILEEGGRVATLDSPLAITCARGCVRLGIEEGPTRRFRLRAAPTVADDPAPRLLEIQGVRYEGALEFLPAPDGSGAWLLVNRLPLERYLLGVLPREMSPSFPAAALRAQAVAARTYALFWCLSAGPRASYHLRNDTTSQVYGGHSADARIENAVTATRGAVLLHEHKLFEAFFHSTCGGNTADGAIIFGVPAIETLTPATCGHCEHARHFRWSCELKERDIRRVLTPVAGRYGALLGEITRISGVDKGPGGHASYLRIEHSGGAFEIDGAVFRRQLAENDLSGVRSTSFECRRAGRSFYFDGRGFGHGVGLCQNGARGMAETGWSAAEILHHYYQQSRIASLW